VLRITLTIVAAVALVTVLLLGVRGTPSPHPPLEWFPDMARQAKYRPQGDSMFFADGRAQRQPPPGTVPWGCVVGDRDPRYLEVASEYYGLPTMPVKLDRALVRRGQEVFETYCRVCHGGYGDGNGITTSYGMLNPPSYHSDRLRQMGDGEMLKTITEGKGQMGPYADRIALEDRWAVIAFVRALQRANDARLEDVPEAEKARLESERESP